MLKINLNPKQRRFGYAFVASVSLHILLAVMIDYVDDKIPTPKTDTPKIMDVVLLDDKKPSAKKAPEDAKTIANRSASGGSKAEDRLTRQAKAPTRGEQQRPQPAPPQQPKSPPPLNHKNRTRLMAKRGDLPDSSQPKKKQLYKNNTKPKEPAKMPISELMPSALALSQQSRHFERERRMKQRLSREADIPINTREAKYAPYAQTLVRALEEQWRPGKTNYKQFAEDARRALIKLTIEKNGDLGGIEILRPSPIAKINDSAVEAINAAAPFKVLPSSWGLDRVSFYLTFEVVEDRFVFRPM